ncbi:uncharacterized protein TRIADDRAFT_58691 [Trichoplax adhaerens]|uniref:Uncharacterized protein n=1 Tax=Trichoplax adhaerens TaxID=10228 RepID=B3S3E7_TRIAD|nr:predicted protein [Trichoplax adhaerens]EDV22777.1 predicted protein [Trichoplax adhaerens]|eukprot:XP_002114643.1 predicted protein [Trichoplax adhaerens]
MKKSPSNKVFPGDALVNNYLTADKEADVHDNFRDSMTNSSLYATTTLPSVTRNQAVFIQHGSHMQALLGLKDTEKATFYYKESCNQLEVTAMKKDLGGVLIQLNEIIGNIKQKDHHLPELLCSYFRSDLARIYKFNDILRNSNIDAVGTISEGERFHVLSLTLEDLSKASQLLCDKYSSVCLEVKGNISHSVYSSNVTVEFEHCYRIKIEFEHYNGNPANTTDIKMAGYIDDILHASQNIYALVEKLKGS